MYALRQEEINTDKQEKYKSEQINAYRKMPIVSLEAEA
jgi:hypothetical protein